MKSLLIKIRNKVINGINNRICRILEKKAVQDKIASIVKTVYVDLEQQSSILPQNNVKQIKILQQEIEQNNLKFEQELQQNKHTLQQEIEHNISKMQMELKQVTSEFRKHDEQIQSHVRQEIDQNRKFLQNEDQQWVNMLRDEIAPIENDTNRSLNEVAISIMQTRQLLSRDQWNDDNSTNVTSDLLQVEDFSKYLQQFKNLHPHLFEVWEKINFGINIENYKNNQIASCAVSNRLDARFFAGFIAPYLNGRVLDIGCGPNPLPYYLEQYPLNLISGIDPLEPFSPHPFEFVRGFAEFLPWSDESFDIVLAATSLDHVIDLDLAFSEIVRVLKRNGLFLVWEWFADEAKPYDPKSQSAQLVDNFHLFNFDNKWFEKVIAKDFEVIEAMKLFGDYRHYNFHCLQVKK
ncbi:MAG: methyltransferase domain-containing protein [Bacteroidales bacterium]|nr:methyltransferase domain-containing protein [Bacteroidales bacterium]